MPTQVLIDYVNEEQKIADDKSFYGVYGASILPVNCWSEDSLSIVFTTFSNFATKTYVLKTGK